MNTTREVTLLDNAQVRMRITVPGEDMRLEHDAIVREQIDRLADRVDVIALGQISLPKISHTARVPILQVGRSGFAEARRLLDQARQAPRLEA